MESIDRQKAQRVWDRVSGVHSPEPDPDTLTALLSQELTDAAVLLRLSKRIGGQGGTLLRLAQGCQQNAGCLRGICALISRNPPSIEVPSPGDTQTQTALRRSYVNLLHRIRAYEALSDDPDYGPVFQAMATTTRGQCGPLLALIGNSDR